MAVSKLMWTGVLCCLGALLINLFPAFSHELGMEPGAAWRIFGFGLFLIILAAALGGAAGRNRRGQD